MRPNRINQAQDRHKRGGVASYCVSPKALHGRLDFSPW
ncbi:hypothetical protein CUTA107171_13750 [Cupriavidus taiwanensis]